MFHQSTFNLALRIFSTENNGTLPSQGSYALNSRKSGSILGRGGGLIQDTNLLCLETRRILGENAFVDIATATTCVNGKVSATT